MTITLEEIRLSRGNHNPPNGEKEGCLLEWASFLAGEPWSDHPQCVSPIIASFGRRWNDDLDNESRQVLVDYLPRIINTRGTRYQEIERYWMVVDWMCRVYMPAWLDLAGLTTEADTVRRLPKFADAKVAKKSQPTLDHARRQGDAARDAAGNAARDAAGAAARDAAGAAARDAAGAAARAAAWDKLRPTTESLQVSALQLLDDLIEVTNAS